MTDETIQISGINRQAFILRGAMAAGAVYGGGMVAPFVGTALAGSGDADILTAAGSIVQVEARHAAAIRLLRGQSPSPEAFDRTLDKNAVLKAVKPLIKA